MGLLAEALGYKSESVLPDGAEFFTPSAPGIDFERGVFEVPYDADGQRIRKGEGAESMRTLDLREGARVRITGGPYAGSEGEMLTRNNQGHYQARFMVTVMNRFKAPWPLKLGSWWVQAAVDGTVPCIPVVTIQAAPEAEDQGDRQNEQEVHLLNGYSGPSMADGGPPPKDLLDEVVAHNKQPSRAS